jgi:hypothetical protein
MLILYGATAGVSVPKLYAAALFPGLMLAGFYMIYVLIRCMLNPSLAPRLPVEQREVLGFDFAKDKGFLVKYVIVAALAFPAIYVGVLFLEWFLNTFRALFTPANMRLRPIDYNVPDALGYIVAAGGVAGREHAVMKTPTRIVVTGRTQRQVAAAAVRNDVGRGWGSDMRGLRIRSRTESPRP